MFNKRSIFYCIYKLEDCIRLVYPHDDLYKFIKPLVQKVPFRNKVHAVLKLYSDYKIVLNKSLCFF